MQFDIFVIPFNIGLYFIIFYAVLRSITWFRELSRQDKLRLQRGFFGRPFVQSLKEIFLESLIHRKILKTNLRLGYMHMSLAFGWFLLILFGTIEADVFGKSHLNPPYKAIFFRFFNPEHGRMGFEAVTNFIMDLILAFILSGLILAVLKRFMPGVTGMKKTTRLKPLDRVALISLWLVFPSRLLAESFTSGAYGTQSFLTGNLGAWFSTFLPVRDLAYPFWWLYSLALGTFFVLLPLTRYMHIPSELFLIFMRNSGIKTGDKAGSFSEVQAFSCSSCGICIDSCQMNSSLGIKNIQPVYLMKAIRRNEGIPEIAHNCLLCGTCDTRCPVGIELLPVRMIQRRNGRENEFVNKYGGYVRKKASDAQEKSRFPAVYDFLPPAQPAKTDVVFFAGCMTHLSPSIIKSMTRILDASGLKYDFIDSTGGVCCGRPLMLAGRDREARELINYNSEMIRRSGAHTLVTSCPICYKVFNESYYLDIKIVHHTEFIKSLIDEDLLKLNFSPRKVVYHSPCELGRGSGVYEAPKEILRYVARLETTEHENEKSLCCGGSLGNMKIRNSSKQKIAGDAARELTSSNPDILATACPLCKKTFAAATDVRVADICEIVADSLEQSSIQQRIASEKLSRQMIIG